MDVNLALFVWICVECVCVCMLLPGQKVFTHVSDLICLKLHDPVSCSGLLPFCLPPYHLGKKQTQTLLMQVSTYQSGAQRSFVISPSLCSHLFFTPQIGFIHQSAHRTPNRSITVSSFLSINHLFLLFICCQPWSKTLMCESGLCC